MSCFTRSALLEYHSICPLSTVFLAILRIILNYFCPALNIVFSCGYNYYMSIFNSKQAPDGTPHPEQKPRFKGSIGRETIINIFDDCSDFQHREIRAGLVADKTLFVCWLDGITDGGDTARDILRPLTDLIRSGSDPTPERLMQGAVYSAQAKLRGDLDDVIDDICSGCVAVVFTNCAVTFEVKSKNQRGITEPKIEQSLKGGKDCFVEILRTNTALVRRRIYNPALKAKSLTLGRKSRTKAVIMYVDGVADPAIIEELERRLDAVDIDGALSSGAIEAYITDRPRSLFPQLLHTERPDRLAQQLLSGRVGLIVDGLPMAFMLPVTFAEFMRVPQDESQHWLIATMLSIVRWLAVMLTLALPALYVAVAMYHQEMIPTKLLMSIVASKQDVPFSTALEVIGMLLAFELLQEAGLRLPNPISETVSIIGALIVGQSAVEAKVISPIAVIVVATAGIAGYAQPSQDMSAALRVCRLALVVAAILAGLFGVAAALCILIWYLCTMDSYGVNYTAPLSGGRPNNLSRTFLRKPLPERKFREPELNTPDKRRQR